MNKDWLEILRCPLTGSELTLVGDRHSGEVEYGILSGDGGLFPVVSGIPILKPGQSEIINLIRSEKYRLATACAIAGAKQSEVAATVLNSTPTLRRLRRFTGGWEQRQRLHWLSRVADEILPEHGEDPDAKALFDFYHRRCGARSEEVYNYNFYRFGMPGVAVSLSLAVAIGAKGGFVLDHSCGAGHITWGIERLTHPATCVAFDLSFFNVYMARKKISRNSWHICGEILQLPFRERIFNSLFNSDAFTNFSAKSAAFREMIRTTASDANIVLSTLRNSLRDHLYPNRPITPAAYRAIAHGYIHRALPDLEILNSYLQGGGIDLTKQPGCTELDKSITISMWIQKGNATFVNSGLFDKPIIPFDELRVNPIFESVHVPGEAQKFVRRWPSKFYENEDKELKHYYPAEFRLSPTDQLALERNDASALSGLIRSGAIVGHPRGYAKTLTGKASAVGAA